MFSGLKNDYISDVIAWRLSEGLIWHILCEKNCTFKIGQENQLGVK